MSAESASIGDVDPAEAGNLWRTEIALRVRELRHRLNAARDATGRGDGAASGGGDGGGGTEVIAVAAQLGGGGVGVAVGETSAPRKAPPLDGVRRASHADATERALADANAAIALRRGPRTWAGRIHAWWTGQTITAAWESVHRAEAELVEIGSDADALASLPQLRAWMRQVLTDRDELAFYEKVFDEGVKERRVDRTVLRQAYQDTIGANIDWHASMRTFRNVLFGVAATLAVVLLGLATWHAVDANVVSLCRTVGTRTICFGEGSRPTGRALFEVLLVGAVGGLLSSAFLLGKIDKAPSRYNLQIPQIVLKAVAGSATALVGVILLQSQVLIAPAGDSSTAVMLAYAAVFGFSQQLLTQFVDRRGADLIKPQADGGG